MDYLNQPMEQTYLESSSMIGILEVEDALQESKIPVYCGFLTWVPF